MRGGGAVISLVDFIEAARQTFWNENRDFNGQPKLILHPCLGTMFMHSLSPSEIKRGFGADYEWRGCIVRESSLIHGFEFRREFRRDGA